MIFQRGCFTTNQKTSGQADGQAPSLPQRQELIDSLPLFEFGVEDGGAPPEPRSRRAVKSSAGRRDASHTILVPDWETKLGFNEQEWDNFGKKRGFFWNQLGKANAINTLGLYLPFLVILEIINFWVCHISTEFEYPKSFLNLSRFVPSYPLHRCISVCLWVNSDFPHERGHGSSHSSFFDDDQSGKKARLIYQEGFCWSLNYNHLTPREMQ